MSNSSVTGNNVISTPKGGGAVSGMGEKFSPDLFTGTGNFSVPIALPPGRNGFQPDITIAYSTGSGNGPFGLGWGLSLPNVSRKTSKGIPLYDDSKDVFLLSGAEDLIPVPGAEQGAQRYQPRTEGLFARIDRYLDKSNDYWKVWSKDGLVSYYGTPGSANSAASYNDPAVNADPSYRSKVFRWLLTRTVDVFGNEIIYCYSRDNRPAHASPQDPHDWDNLYLEEIRYADYKEGSETKYLVSVKFIYEDRTDASSDYKAGFEIRTTKRCIRIEVYTHAEGSNTLTKTYHFVYLDARVASGELAQEVLPLNGVSLLSQVKIEGHDGSTSEWMPPLEFSYTAFSPLKRDFYPIGGKNLPSVSLGNPDYELADMFGNGLPDIIQMNGVARYWKNLGNGLYDLPREMKDAPAGMELADPEVSMMDAQGDGKIDLVVTKQGVAGYFPLKHSGLWDRKSFKPYKNIPSFSLADPEVVMLDLDGDGVTDVMRNGSRLECFFNDPEKGFYKMVPIDKKRLKHFPDVSFADPRIRTVDMSGDGMQDIVMIHDGLIEYWPNMGHGKWGARVAMKHSPRFPYRYDPARILIGDVDGDGLSDIIYVENNKVTLWINRNGNEWSEPVVITGTPPVHSMASVRLADLLGSGVSGIVWSYDYDGSARDRMFYFDFTGGLKPYLLNEMNNHMGAITRVEYASSMKYYLEDEQRPETRWKTTLPFPVLVVAKVEVIDELSGGKLVTEYSYHHGYWDGGEREFRGFGRVEQKDTESFERYNGSTLKPVKAGEEPFNTVQQLHYTPPMLTRTWFHLGPVGDETGEWNEVDFSNEYWPEDPNVLERPQEMMHMIKALPRRARRDAYRTLRGSILRSELYALDQQPGRAPALIRKAGVKYSTQDRPYTVSENLQGVRLQYVPSNTGTGLSYDPEANNRAGSGYIFFSHGLASRTTQWERGSDPLVQFSFTDDYDIYGIPRKQAGMAVPRGRSPLGQGGSGTVPYLCTYAESDFIHKDTNTHYLIGRALSARSYEVVNDGSLSVFALKEQLFGNPPLTGSTPGAPGGGADFTYKLLSHSVTYYDGDAYTGLPYGQLGSYGVPVRTETLVMTDAQVEEVYGSSRPPYLIAHEGSPLPATVWSPEYPAGFQAAAGQHPNAGYHYHAAGSIYEEGFYTIADRKKFDFHVNPATAKGLVVKMMDPLGDEVTESRTATVTYDSYQMLPVTVTDPIDMQTTAAYDYRVMQAKQITDPNQNRVQFAFSPLGFLYKSAVMGKESDTTPQGDTLDDPGTWMEYDFFAWMERRQPVHVKTTVREYHVHDTSVASDKRDNTIQSIQYSDGFGRLIQTRSQCEEMIFGDTLFGDAGLPPAAGGNGNAVGTLNEADGIGDTSINVLVSGWQVYNNKGLVVEKYEPYYDKGFDFDMPSMGGTAGQALLLSRKVRMYYDPRGQVIRTHNPDGTEQRVVFGIPLGLDNPNVYEPTPWESYTYDANDLAPLYTVPAGYVQTGTVPAAHHFTPASSLIDALGRTVKTVDRLVSTSDESQQVVMQYEFDIRGNLTRVIDPEGRDVFIHKYDLANRPLWTKHIDAGEKTVVMDCMDKPWEMRDAKGALVLNSYDVLNRPEKVWARDRSGESLTLRQKTVYGDSTGSEAEALNLKGKPYMIFDEAGLTLISSYDFKGNPPEKLRKVIADNIILSAFSGPPASWNVNTFRADWESSPPGLDPFQYVTSMKYDALNRVTEMTYPEDVTGGRKILYPAYNRAGHLVKVDMKDSSSSDPMPYVERISYNARGQRTMIAFGKQSDQSGMMTRYAYDPFSFRLMRMKTEKYTATETATTATYTPQSGTTVQELLYVYDLAGNIRTIWDSSPGSGYGGSLDNLFRTFEYDALYRLLKATGREKDVPRDEPFYDTFIPADPTKARGYVQNYQYDKLGNIQELSHTAANGGSFTRSFSYATGKNKLQSITIGSNTYSFVHDVNGNITSDDNGGSRFHEYDYADRLRSFRVQAGTSEPTQYAHYLYDAGGNRVKKLVRKQGGGYSVTVYIDGIYEYHKHSGASDAIPNIQIGSWTIGSDNDGEYNILHVMDDQARIATRRVGDDTGAISGDTTPAIKYHVDDHLGSSAILLNYTTGAVVSREEYYPFGETSFGSYAKKRYRFCGKEKDEESGLYYYGMRYYAPWTCRFVSVDPLAAKYPFYTPYQYAGNHPINFIDLDGAEQALPDGTANANQKPPSDTNSKNDKKEEGGGMNGGMQEFIETGTQEIGGHGMDAEEASREGSGHANTNKTTKYLQEKRAVKETDAWIKKLNQKGYAIDNHGVVRYVGFKKDGKLAAKGNQYFTTNIEYKAKEVPVPNSAKGEVSKLIKVGGKLFWFVGTAYELSGFKDSLASDPIKNSLKAGYEIVFAISFVVNDKLAEMNEAMFADAIRLGFESSVKHLAYGTSDIKDLSKKYVMVFLSKEEYQKLQEGTLSYDHNSMFYRAYSMNNADQANNLLDLTYEGLANKKANAGDTRTGDLQFAALIEKPKTQGQLLNVLGAWLRFGVR